MIYLLFSLYFFIIILYGCFKLCILRPHQYLKHGEYIHAHMLQCKNCNKFLLEPIVDNDSSKECDRLRNKFPLQEPIWKRRPWYYHYVYEIWYWYLVVDSELKYDVKDKRWKKIKKISKNEIN